MDVGYQVPNWRTVMNAQIPVEINNVVLQRVYSEFAEMPGLHLTSKQAQRLWGLDEQTCTRLLEFLVDAKFLCRGRHGRYVRLTDGPTRRLQPSSDVHLSR
jgi:hypothetical protein